MKYTVLAIFATNMSRMGSSPRGRSGMPRRGLDAQDNVYVLTRGAHPIMVFDREGNYQRSFGETFFSDRTHGLYMAHDSSLLVADDGIHTIQKFNTDGER